MPAEKTAAPFQERLGGNPDIRVDAARGTVAEGSDIPADPPPAGLGVGPEKLLDMRSWRRRALSRVRRLLMTGIVPGQSDMARESG